MALATRGRRWGRGFSLVELVIVVVILGIIGAIAIPRMSRGAAGAADSGVVADLAVLRNAIELYAAEHGGEFPDASKVENQLLKFSDEFGNTSDSKDTTHVFGPYLAGVPPLKVGANKGNSKIAAADGTDVGWIYDDATGEIVPNATESDERGVDYADY